LAREIERLAGNLLLEKLLRAGQAALSQRVELANKLVFGESPQPNFY
jgi:hypothetical protein